MLSYENNLADPSKSNGKSTVQHNSSDENIISTGDNNSLPEAEHQLISSSVAVPNFSIRDFVFSARNKDIGTNWPFPDKHLKLCLKNGVKQLLPPFESKTCERKPYSTICLDTNSLVEDGIITRIWGEDHSERFDNLTVLSLGDVGLTQKVAVHHLDVSFDKRDKDSDFISSDTSNSQVYPSRAGSTFKHHRFLKTSAKTSSSKCKLVVKFGSPSVHCLNEERMPHKNNLYDLPASNVCPVCKTFSSSSNTTLNAHIDQCLSMETASEGMAYSRTGTKFKVKPRKMRSMVDIYATALLCTIEDLDRRNGSNWATDLTLPARNTGASSTQENKNQISSPTEPDREDNDDSGVYIDANGRKLRILSKMDSFSSVVTTKEDNGSRKSQLNKALSSSKKKHHGNKHNKYLKLAVSNERRLAPKADSCLVLQPDKPSAESMLRKGSGELAEVDTFRDEGSCQLARHQLHSIQCSTQKSRLGDFNVENSSFQDSYRDSACLSERHMRVKSPDGTHISSKHCLGVKRTRTAISKDYKHYNTDTTVHKRLKKSTEKPLNQLTRSYKGMNENGLSTTKHVHRFLQQSAKLRWNNTSSACEQLALDSNIWKKTPCATNEADQVQFEVEEDEDVDNEENVAAWQSESHVIHDAEHAPSRPSTAEGRATELKKDRRGTSHKLEDIALTVDTSDENFDDLSMPLSGSKVVEHGRTEILTDTRKNLNAEGIMRRFVRSMNPDDQERDDSYEYQSSPQASNDTSAVPNSVSSPLGPVLDEGVSNSYNMELGSEATQGDPCSDIDPIPIPGPPGSFLPSPGNAETVDYQGNSSLTGSLSSSHYEQDGGNSSKSPTSSASNFAAETSEKVSKKALSTGIHANPVFPLLGFPIPSSEVSMVETSLFPDQAIKFGSTRCEYRDQKSYMKLQDGNQSCCCSRKERIQRGSVVEFQESQLLRRRTMSATFLPTKDNISCSLNTAPSYSSAGRAVDIPVLKAPATPKHPDTMNANKFHANRDLESASPSAVLRLMGKNLMVAKNDEDLSGLPRDDTVSPSKPRNLKSYSSQIQKVVPPDPVTNTPPYSSNVRLSYDFGMSNGGPWGEMNFPRPGATDHLQAALVDHKWPVQHFKPSSGLDMMHDHMLRGPASSFEFRKTGGSEGGAASRNGATVTNSLNYSGALSVAVYPPAISSSTHVHMQQQVPGNTCFPVPFSSTAGRYLNPSQVNNYYRQSGTYVMHGVGGGPFMASSLSSSTHPKSRGLFYSTPKTALVMRKPKHQLNNS